MSKRKSGELTLLVGYDPVQDVCSVIPISAREGRRYVDLHHLLPLDIEFWSDEQLHALAAKCTRKAGRRKWGRALVFLAHHRSRLAYKLLGQLKPRVPPKLREIYEAALEESRSWLSDSNDLPAASNGDIMSGIDALSAGITQLVDRLRKSHVNFPL